MSNILNVATHSLMFFVMAIVFAGSVKEHSLSKGRREPFLFLLGSDVVLLFFKALQWFFRAGLFKAAEHRFAFVAVSLIAESSYFCVLLGFVYFLVDYLSKKTRISFWWAHCAVPVCALYALGWCASIFNGMFVRYSRDAVFSHGDLYAVSGWGGVFVASLFMFLVVRHRRVIGRGDVVALLSFVFLPLLVQVSQTIRSFCSMTIALSLSALCIFVFVHVHQARLFQEQEVRLAQGKVALMLSQVRPHFIFNALNSIYVLCDIDTEAVKKAVGDFSKYLRANLEVLEDDSLISFEKELDHVRHYLNLEQLRFREDLTVEYDIRASDFKIPPLTLQPLVENAVKHGILPKKGGGTVRISSIEKDGFFEVSVSDDGVGFAADALGERNDGKGERGERTFHVGIKNVRERLWAMCGGLLEIESEIGSGTRVTIQLNGGGNADSCVR